MMISSLSRSHCCVSSRPLLRVRLYANPISSQPQSLRLFSSASNNKLSSSISSYWNRNSQYWKRVARVVKYIRIPFLVLSVYGFGYQQGIIDDSRNPQGTQQALLDNVFASVGVYDRAHVHIVQDGDSYLKSSNKSCKRIAKIGRSIVKVARQYVQQQIELKAKEIRAKLPLDITEEQFLAVLMRNDDFQRWYKAKSQLEGNWSYLLLETKLPNAFVSEILPKRIFVTISMLDIISNDDELALVLGHEVSHLILGHVSERNTAETTLRTMEVLLLSVDPTEGLLSLAVVGALAGIRQAVTASFSRDHEREADELGMKLAAMACYDTQRASTVFQRLHEKEQVPSTGTRLLSFADSHPPTEERYRDLVSASETENADSYDHCATVKKKLASSGLSLI